MAEPSATRSPSQSSVGVVRLARHRRVLAQRRQHRGALVGPAGQARAGRSPRGARTAGVAPADAQPLGDRHARPAPPRPDATTGRPGRRCRASATNSAVTFSCDSRVAGAEPVRRIAGRHVLGRGPDDLARLGDIAGHQRQAQLARPGPGTRCAPDPTTSPPSCTSRPSGSTCLLDPAADPVPGLEHQHVGAAARPGRGRRPGRRAGAETMTSRHDHVTLPRHARVRQHQAVLRPPAQLDPGAVDPALLVARPVGVLLQRRHGDAGCDLDQVGRGRSGVDGLAHGARDAYHLRLDARTARSSPGAPTR